MNLLVTNTRNRQAYGIIRSLRPHCNKIVATMYGPNRMVARLSHVANSRLVDKRYYVPSPVEDWKKGVLQRENTENEEEYIQAILRICEREGIDVIFPSWEPKTYIFSKNKARFKERKIVLPVPDYDALSSAMDKEALIKIAQKAQFPCPKTFAEDQLEAIEQELEYPVVIKPRMSSGSRGFFLVRSRTELLERISSARRSQGSCLIQEYIPGSLAKRFTSIWIVLDQNYNLIGSTLHRKLRTIFRDGSSQGSAWESFRDDGLVDQAIRLSRALNLTGIVNIQTKLDSRDGIHKLLEVNPRIGYNYWIPLALGLDAPVLALNIAREQQLQTVPQRHSRTVFISPVEDMWALGAYFIELFAAKALRYRPPDPENLPMPVRKFLDSYRDSYNASRTVFDPFFADFFHDPWVSLTWWAAYATFTVSAKFRQISSFRRRAKSGPEATPADESSCRQYF